MASINLVTTDQGNPQTESKTPVSPLRKWGLLVVLSLALCIIILDTTILNVALGAIIRDLHTDIQKIQWVITAYSLTLAALTITGGRLGDIFGRKRMFVVGAILFAIGSFLASISTSVGMLIAGEAIIEGIGAALMMPATASLLVVNFQGRERAIAFGIWGGIAGASAALGPILGGYLTTQYDWRWGFRINLFVVIALLIGSIIIPESRDTKERKELDIFGVVLSALGMLSFVFGLIEASTYGWWKAKMPFIAFGHTLNMPWDLSIVPICMAIGVAILALFGWYEYRREKAGHTPLVSMGLFKNARFTAGASTTAVMSLGQTGLIFSLPVFLQSVRGLDAFHTGLALLPMSLGLLIVAPLSAALSKKISPKLLINLGLLINVFAYLILRQTLNIETTSTDLIPGLAIFGIGMGLVMSQINNLTLSAVSIQQAGEASGVNNTLRQVGSTLGSAIIGTILIGTLSTHLMDGVRTSTIIPEPAKANIAEVMSTQTSNVEFGGGAHVDASISPEIKNEIIRIGHQATVDANKETLLYSSLFAAFGFLVSLLLPSSRKKKSEEAVLNVSPQPTKRLQAAPQPLQLNQVAELITLDQKRIAQGLSSLGADLRLVMDAALAHESLTESNPRLAQTRTLWDLGFGQVVGVTDFTGYLQGIPAVPAELQVPNETFPYLILVDGRVPAIKAAELLGIQVKGNEATHSIGHLREQGKVYWIRCNDGGRYLGKSAKEVEQHFSSGEKGLSATEGLAFLAQKPQLLQNHYLDLVQAAHDGFENSIACLGIWGGKTELRWRWRDHADPRCQTASRLA